MSENRLQELFEIRIARKSDIDSIIAFYRRNWISGHIISNDRNFLLFEHLEDERFNFVIAKNRNNREVMSAIGFTDYGGQNEFRHISSTMLAVSPQCKTPFLGIDMIRELKNLTVSDSYCGVTTNPITLAPFVKRFLQHHVGTFDHLYVANSDFREYKILSGDIATFKSVGKKPFIELKELHYFESILDMRCIGERQASLPYKSLPYLLKRYFSHPIFKYRFFKLSNTLDGQEAFIVAKIETVSQRSAFRIIDFIGPLYMLNDLSFRLNDLIQSEGHEYADLFCSNASSFLSSDHCFSDRRKTNCIVPHYFYPYFHENIEVLYETDKPEYVYFKGDGDGDRPSYRVQPNTSVMVRN